MSNSFESLEKRIYSLFHKKYKSDDNIYNINRINSLLFDDKKHLVAIFKDYLISDDQYEFFKRFYKCEESKKRLSKYIEYYEKYSFVFPNYTSLPESEYLYENINKKQRIIDQQENEIILKQKKIENKNNLSKKENIDNKKENSQNNLIKDKNEKDNNILFDSKVYNSILKLSEDFSLSQFGIEKPNEKIDSISEIKSLITEIDTANSIELKDSPAEPISNNSFINKLYIEINEDNNNTKNNENNIGKLAPNFCYNKFKNRDGQISLNKNNQNSAINNNTPVLKNKNKNIISPSLYTKNRFKKKYLSDIQINNSETLNKNNTNNTFMKNKINNHILNTNQNNSSNNTNKNFFVYRKLSPINVIDKLSFSIKKGTKNESLKTINYFPSKTKSINPINYKKKNIFKFEVFSYDNKSKLINNSNKNNNNNNINQYLYSKRRANSEINCNYKSKNFLNFIPRENTVYYINNNSSHKENKKIIFSKKNNIKSNQQKSLYNNNNKYIKTSNNIVRTKSLSFKKNSISNLAKPCINNNLIDLISNRIKKESQSHISKRILLLISNKKKNNVYYSSKKKNSISFNNHFSLNKIQNKTTQNNNASNLGKNKLILSMDKSSLYNYDSYGSLPANLNKENNKIMINGIPMNNIKYKISNNFTTPNSIRKHISFKQYINNNFSTINNTYNCQLFPQNKDMNMNKPNNLFFSIKQNNQKISSDNPINSKYINNSNSNTLNYKKLSLMNNDKNVNYVISKNNKKKILIVRKKDNNKCLNKNIKNINNKSKINSNDMSNSMKIRDIENNKVIGSPKGLYNNDTFKIKNRIIKNKISNNNKIFNNN